MERKRVQNKKRRTKRKLTKGEDIMAYQIDVLCDPSEAFLRRLSKNFDDVVNEKARTPEVFDLIFEYQKQFYQLLQMNYPRMSVWVTGSSVSGIALKNSDVDVTIITDPYFLNSENMANSNARIHLRRNSINKLRGIQKALRFHRDLDQVQLIKAVVPVLKFRCTSLNLHFDMTIDVNCGIKSTILIKLYTKLSPILRKLIIIVKLWAESKNINDAPGGTFSSYALVVLVLFYVQCMESPPLVPNIFELFPDQLKIRTTTNDVLGLVNSFDSSFWCPKNTPTLGHLFRGFIKFYSTFSWEENTISLRTASIKPREDLPTKHKIYVEEPFDLSNVCRSVQCPVSFCKILKAFHTVN